MTIPFNKIRSEGNFREIFGALERGFTKFGIDFYLVGAIARDVWMRGVHEIPPKRATSDIDFGVMIKDSYIFEDLKNYFHFNSDAIFEHHNDLFGDNELDEIAAQYLGREIGKITSGNKKLTERVTNILERGLSDSNPNSLDELLARESGVTIDYSRSLIAHILAGIKETTV